MLTEKDFVRLNLFVDDLIEDKELSGVSSSFSSTDINADTLDVWDPSFKPQTAFEKDSLAEIQSYWSASCESSSQLLSRSALFSWQDVLDLIKDGDLTEGELDGIWNEAVTSMSKAQPFNNGTNFTNSCKVSKDISMTFDHSYRGNRRRLN